MSSDEGLCRQDADMNESMHEPMNVLRIVAVIVMAMVLVMGVARGPATGPRGWGRSVHGHRQWSRAPSKGGGIQTAESVRLRQLRRAGVQLASSSSSEVRPSKLPF